MEHTIHLMACHFVKGLGVPALGVSKARIHGIVREAGNSEGGEESGEGDKSGELDEYDEEFDVETSMEVEPSTEDVDAIHTLSVTDFVPGDIVGKLMAFISQLWLCSEDVREYLKQLSVSMGCPSWDIKLCVRTHWKSLSDCFCVVLAQQKV